MTPCPTEDELLFFIDGALSLEDTEDERSHQTGCPRCRQEDATLRALLDDIAAPARERLNVRAHVDAVMARLDEPARGAERPRRKWLFTSVGSLAAAALALALVVGVRGPRGTERTDTWLARGGTASAGLERDVGVQLYTVGKGAVEKGAVGGELRPLEAGALLGADAPLTAGFRNLGHAPVFLLLFAVDAHDTVHWISPEYREPGDDPSATALPTSVTERMLDTTASFEDVSAGPLHILAVVTPGPTHVSDIESLPGTELSREGIARHLAGASVRETVVRAYAAGGGAH